MSDPIDPNTGRGKKEDGWKTVMFESPFAQQQQGGPFPPPPQGPGASHAQPPQVQNNAPQGRGPIPNQPNQSQPGQGAPPYQAGAYGAAPQGFPPPPAANFPPQAYPAPYGGAPAPPAYPAPYGQPVKKRKTWVWVLLILLSVLLLGFVGCVAALYKLGKAHMAVTPEAAVKQLHSRMKDNDAAAIYRASDPAYKQQVTRSQSDAEFVRVSALLGAPRSFQLMETRPVESQGQDVIDTYVLTTFEKGSANEHMEWRKLGGEYKLVAYGIQSDNLR